MCDILNTSKTSDEDEGVNDSEGSLAPFLSTKGGMDHEIKRHRTDKTGY